MFFKKNVLVFMLIQIIVLAFGVDVQAKSLKSMVNVKCFGLMKPVLQVIAIRKEQVDRFDEVIQNKENKLVEVQTKYDQVQNKCAVAETAFNEKEHQLVQQQDLCNSKEEQIQQLLSDAKEAKEQLESYKSQIKSKDQQLEKLHAEIHWKNVKVQELENKQKNKNQQIAELQAEVKKMLDQRSALGLKVNANEMQIEKKQSEIRNLQSKLHGVQAELSEYRNQIDQLPSTNCRRLSKFSAIHTIRARGMSPFEVLSDSRLAGPGWIVIQRRIDGSENFYRNWSDYREGFGNLEGEFFIGMEKLYRLTNGQAQELYIHLEAFDNSIYFARYADFSIGSESEAYRLAYHTYTGNASDGLHYASSRKFSTYDVDNDNSWGNCAEQKHGAWWYDQCGHSNLNGPYLNEANQFHKGIYWIHTHPYSFKTVQMMLRPMSTQYKC